LDVAFDLGYDILKDLTEEAHQQKQGSMIVGEIWNYPQKWLDSIDGVMNFTLREIIYKSVNNEISPQMAIKMISKMIDDAGIEGILKSWNVLDNHDVTRLFSQIKEKSKIQIAQILQFMLPGSPNLYYGTELGMQGKGDPENRAPMRWDLLKDDNEIYQWTKKLIELHHKYRALKIGDFRPIMSEKMLAFERYTDKVEDTILVVINLLDQEIEESMLVTNSDLMNYSGFDIILGDVKAFQFLAGFLTLKLPKKSFIVLKPKVNAIDSYTPYKRV